MIDDTGLEELCAIGRETVDLVQAIEACWNLPFEQDQIDLRKERLGQQFDNRANAVVLAELLGLELGV